MLGFSQTHDLSSMYTPNRTMIDWSDQTLSTNNFCDEIDEIDEIMKHEHEDVILLDDSLSVPPLDLDLDSISDLLENPSSSSIATSNFTEPLNINELTSTSTAFSMNNNNNSRSTTTSAYSSLGISPKFTTLSLNNHYIQSNNLHLPLFVQQQDNSIFGTSYPNELQSNTNGQSDVKRFRSASMNDGPSSLHQHNKLDLTIFDPNRFKSPNYVNLPSYQNKPASLTVSTDVSSNSAWCPRPSSNSFSEVENQQQRLRLKSNLSSSFNGSSNFHYRRQTRFPNETKFQPQTLYSINQSTNEDSTPPTRKRPSLVDFPVEEIKDDPSSPSCTIEQHSETELWSDYEQNSSDHIQDDDNNLTSDDDDDDETTVSTSTKPSGAHPSSSLFWQYNVQSKGPKTKRILYLKERDPHLHREFSDPVYQIKLTQTKGQTFNKLRKGDGNDVTPNPMKLYELGKQIRDLSNNSSSVYHGIYHADPHTNNNDTAEVKKEKNKIASRACRLRKKAQHEANKVKLHGLNEEHKSLIDIIASTKLIILKRYQQGQLTSPSSSPNSSLEAAFDQLIANKYNQPVAGNSDGFVQTIINDMELLYTPKQQRSYSLNT
ncbi:unnamed protein product [Adineta steineri]|uniref:BZIP domain-containing protein n=1 Tax=Adineta steineri TaxID=433720 RepID=A0A814MRZ5_9BILA|nr:unnamed protein product [Adineta steineri]CAF1217989.1 unnamed protein product [Adineta steineri]